MSYDVTMRGEPRCKEMYPLPLKPDHGFPPTHYERCIHADGHEGMHDDVYGRWWGSIRSEDRDV